jgi:hypothetical protein
MAAPVPEPACQHDGDVDLRALLGRLRTHLWERWPLRLQYRLAAMTAGANDEPEALVRTLAVAIEAHARQGSVGRDMSADTLARVVLALLTGDVAQRFVAREQSADPAIIDGMVCLLSADWTAAAWSAGRKT